MSEKEAVGDQKGDPSLEEYQMLYEKPFTLNFTKIPTIYDKPPSVKSAKFVSFLTALLVLAACAYTLQFYLRDPSPKDTAKRDQKLTKGASFDGQIEETQDKRSANFISKRQFSKGLQVNGQKNEGKSQQLQYILQELKQLKGELQAARQEIVVQEVRSQQEIARLKKVINNKQGQENHDLGIEIRKESDQFMTVDRSYVFKVPRVVWLYEEKVGNYMGMLTLKNIRNVAKASGFEVLTVNADTLKAHLSPLSYQRANYLITTLKKRLDSGNSGNLQNHIWDIVKSVVLLSVLHEKGGVILSGPFALTEQLSWLEEIARNEYANRGNRGAKPQVVGFYSPYYSSEMAKENIKTFEGMNEVDKFMVVYPAMERYFIAADRNTTFVGEVVEKISSLLLEPQQFKRERNKYSLSNLHGDDMYYQYFLLAVQTILQDTQRTIDLHSKLPYRRFAIDFYGLYLINCLYAPYKLNTFWGKNNPSKAFNSMTQYAEQEFLDNVGPLRYLTKITPEKQANQYIQDAMKGKRQAIMEGSFIQKLFFPEPNLPFIKKNLQKPFINANSEQWEALPRIIWVFWDTGLSNSRISNQLCVQNLKRMGGLSGFRVVEVNLSNIEHFLDKSTLNEIKYSLENSKLKTYPQSKGDLYRLALLAKHGGIYMDASYIALESFEWLLKISQYPSQYIFNRFGALPKVVMLWHPHYGSPFEWTINEKYNTKSQWHLSYENNFIAAEKDSDLIKDWLEMLLSLYLQPYEEVEATFRKCQIYEHKWIGKDSHYLLAMDAIKCVLGMREQQLTADPRWEGAADFYRLWSMSGYLGQQKLRSNTNFEKTDSHDNPLLYRYSQQYAEGLVGKIRHLTKFYSLHNEELAKFIANHRDGNFSTDTHPQSVFIKHLWTSKLALEGPAFAPKLKLLP